MATTLEAVRELVEKHPTEHSVSCELSALNKVNQTKYNYYYSTICNARKSLTFGHIFHAFPLEKGSRASRVYMKGSGF